MTGSVYQVVRDFGEEHEEIAGVYYSSDEAQKHKDWLESTIKFAQATVVLVNVREKFTAPY